jgi:Pyridoxal-dependent decarboxylase, C-terminal sheet domain
MVGAGRPAAIARSRVALASRTIRTSRRCARVTSEEVVEARSRVRGSMRSLMCPRSETSSSEFMWWRRLPDLRDEVARSRCACWCALARSARRSEPALFGPDRVMHPPAASAAAVALFSASTVSCASRAMSAPEVTETSNDPGAGNRRGRGTGSDAGGMHSSSIRLPSVGISLDRLLTSRICQDGGSPLPARSAGDLLPAARFRPLPARRSGSSTGQVRVAPAGIAVYRVLAVKHTHAHIFVAVDGGMSDNPRPALHGSRYTVRLIGRTTNAEREGLGDLVLRV